MNTVTFGTRTSDGIIRVRKRNTFVGVIEPWYKTSYTTICPTCGQETESKQNASGYLLYLDGICWDDETKMPSKTGSGLDALPVRRLRDAKLKATEVLSMKKEGTS